MILTRILSRLLRRDSAAVTANRRLDEWLQRGYRFQRNGEFEQARQLYLRVLKDAPHNVDAHYLLGALLGESGELGEAGSHLEQALAVKPDFTDAYAALGNVRLLQGDEQAALASYEQALLLDPNCAPAHSNLGLLHQRQGRTAAALQEFRLAYQVAPDLPDLLKNLTLAHINLEQYDAALALLDPVLLVQPHNVEALKCKGFVLQKMHHPDLALGYYQTARALVADDPELLNNLGIVLQELGDLDPAIECYDEAISLRPDFPLAIWHRSLAYLLCHDFARGWPDYELRSISIDQPKRPQLCPQWDGAALKGRSILVYAEQGLGDEIMFASCLPDVIAASAHCVIDCSPKLETMFRRSFPAATVCATTPSRDFPAAVQDAGVELQTGAGSLPQYLRRSLADFPRHDGYLRADPRRETLWRERLAQLGAGIKVGISWQGGTPKTRRQVRSLPLMRWLPILSTPGVSFVNLQYTDCSLELAEFEVATGIKIADWQEVRDDYEHTAALVSALDVVISVCTAVIHLGGALGRPVWIMAPFSPEWRYGFSGEKMPWYPSSRMFRQPAFGQWEPVIDQVARELAILTASGAAG